LYLEKTIRQQQGASVKVSIDTVKSLMNYKSKEN